MSGLGMSNPSPMAFQSHDSNTGGSNISNPAVSVTGGAIPSGNPGGVVNPILNPSPPVLDPSPEKPVTNPRTPTERKRKRKTTATGPNLIQSGGQSGVPPGGPPGGLSQGGQLSDIMASEASKTNKPISEYFPKRAPSSPARGGTKSPLSFGPMYPQSPKTPYVSSPSGTSNGPPMSYNQGEFYPQPHPHNHPTKMIQTDLTSAEITKRSADLDNRNNRIDELQRMNDEMSRYVILFLF